MAVHVQRLTATRASGSAPEVVLIHGWGMSSTVWSSFLPRLRRCCNVHLLDLPGYGASDFNATLDIDSLLEEMLQVLPEQAVYLGYSLGGMLAVKLAIAFPQRVQGVITLASNAKFIASEDWPWAMPEATFQQFADSIATPTVALKRFAGLQALGCEHDKALTRTLRDQQEQLPAEVLVASLDWLAALDWRSQRRKLSVPALFCFAENDALVPAIVAEQFTSSSVAVVAGAAHAMFLSHPDACEELIFNFLRQHTLLDESNSTVQTRNKQDVAKSFSRAATTYDSVAELQRQVGESLIKQVPDLAAVAGQPMVDLGCGTGYFYPTLKRLRPGADLIGVDLAEGMVRYAANKRKSGLWVCGDAENLPLPESSVSLIFSSLTIQWCEDVEALFAEVYRVLSPGGQMIFSTLGPNTLFELRQAWQEVDGYTHVNNFLPWETLRNSMASAGFWPPQQPQKEWVTLEYNTLSELTAELKQLGAHNVNSGRPVGLTGKTRIKQFIAAYENQRNDKGFLPASYEVWYCVLSKPGDI